MNYVEGEINREEGKQEYDESILHQAGSYTCDAEKFHVLFPRSLFFRVLFL
jgi:hypothetical protein